MTILEISHKQKVPNSLMNDLSEGENRKTYNVIKWPTWSVETPSQYMTKEEIVLTKLDATKIVVRNFIVDDSQIIHR